MSRLSLLTSLVGFCLILIISATQVQSAAAEPAPGKYTLRADTGNYLSRCNGCVPGGADPDSASVHATTSDGPWSQWTLARLPNGKWTLQADTGKYLSRCNGCGPGAYPDSAFVHATSADGPWSQWSLEQRPSGRWALKSDTGRYLARCNGCFRGAPYPDMAFVHETNPDAPWAQWTLTPLFAAPAQPVASPQPVATSLHTAPIQLEVTDLSPSLAPATASPTDINAAIADLQQKVTARNIALVKLNMAKSRLSSGTQAAAPWATMIAALTQYGQSVGIPESTPISPSLLTLFGTLNDQSLVSSIQAERLKAMQNQIADATNILNVCTMLDSLKQAQAAAIQARIELMKLGGATTGPGAITTTVPTQTVAPSTSQATVVEPSTTPQLFEFASQQGSYEGLAIDSADCLADSKQNKSGALFSVDKTCESRSFWVDIDCYHTKLNSTDTKNTVSVNFYSNNTLVGTKTMKGVTSCGPVSTDPRWALDTRSSINKVVVAINGSDGFYIDELYIYQDGTLKKHYGKDDGKGWCLSTDPNDARYWKGYIIDNVCSSTKEFSVY